MKWEETLITSLGMELNVNVSFPNYKNIVEDSHFLKKPTYDIAIAERCYGRNSAYNIDGDIEIDFLHNRYTLHISNFWGG